MRPTISKSKNYPCWSRSPISSHNTKLGYVIFCWFCDAGSHINIKWSMATMYISLWELFSGASPIIIVLCNFLRKLMVSNKMILRGSENSYNSYEQYPLEKFLIFTIYQNYTLALMVIQVFISKMQLCNDDTALSNSPGMFGSNRMYNCTSSAYTQYDTLWCQAISLTGSV